MKNKIETRNNNIEKTDSKVFLQFLFLLLILITLTQLSSNNVLANQNYIDINDPIFPDQWNLQSETPNSTDWDLMFELLSQNEFTPQKQRIRIAVVDSGVNINHPDLFTNNGESIIWTNPNEEINGVDDDNNGFIDDLHGCAFTPEDNSCLDATSDLSLTQHGTGTTSIIGAGINNNNGIVGTAFGYEVEIVPLKVTQSNGVANFSDIREAMNYIEGDGNFDVVSINLASWVTDTAITDLNEQISRISQDGTVFVAGSGNNGETITEIGWPARHPDVISVGGTNKDGNRRPSSNYGPNLDLVAPAEQIYMACYEQDYCFQSGTSFSGPQVTAAVGFIKAFFPELNVNEVRELLQNSSTGEFNNEIGHGILNYHQLAINLLLREKLYLPIIMN